MLFTLLDEEGLYPQDIIEITTLGELKAFALSGSGRIEIGYKEIDYDGNIIIRPVINKIKYLSRGKYDR